MPIHGPQATSSSRTPALMSFVMSPLVSMRSSVWREPGETATEIPGAMRLWSSACATMLRSRNEEFTLLPTATCATSVPATSRTGFTLSGLQAHVHDLGHRDTVRFARHRARDLEAARADREHPAGTGVGRVRITPDHALAGDVVGLHVGPVADPVPGAGEDRPVPLAGASQETVVVGVLVSGLQDIVIDVLRRLAHLDGRPLHLLELEPGKRPRPLLEQGLAHPPRGVLAGVHFPFREVRSNQLVRERFGHGAPSTADKTS